MPEERDIEYYKAALREIAYGGTSQAPAAAMPDADWYRIVALGLVSLASRALAGTWEPDDA